MAVLQDASRIRFVLGLLGAGLLLLAASGCAHQAYSHRHVHHPPTPAPVHGRGHLYVHSGLRLVFDHHFRCYVVPGHAHHYFWHGHYYRHHHGHWQTASHLRGPWRAATREALPPGLRRGYLAAERNRSRTRWSERDRTRAEAHRKQEPRLEEERVWRAPELEEKRLRSCRRFSPAPAVPTAGLSRCGPDRRDNRGQGGCRDISR